MSEKPFSQIELLEQYAEKVDAMISRLKEVGAKEEFYALEESANKLVESLEALETPEKDDLISRLTGAVIGADIRVSEGREEIEGEGPDALEDVDAIISEDIRRPVEDDVN